MSTPSVSTHHRACNLCEAICGLVIEHRDGQVLSIRGDVEDPLSRGHICPKAVALQDLYSDPDRLRQPLRRDAAGHWQPISWQEALGEAAARLHSIQQTHGRDAVALYQGNPTVHNYGAMLFTPQLARTLGSRNRFTATSVDQLPHHLAAYWMFGHQMLLPVPDLDRTRFLLIFGANPAASNGSLMTAPDVKKRLKAIRERGGRVVVFDPRRTETARLADEHHFVRPGSDVLVLAALLHTMLGAGLAAPGRLASFIDGLDQLPDLLKDFTPERVAAATGVPAAAIRQLAHDFAAAEAAVCYGRLGVSVQEHGALCQWLIQVLNVVTGNLDRPGGAMFTRPAVDLVASTSRGSYGRWRSRVRGLPEASGELPVSVLAEEILTPGPGQVRALVVAAGNPVLSTPNGGQLEQALASLDFMVAVDFYLNETTRHAHLILPPTTPLEHDHYDLVFHALAVRNTARYSPPLRSPEPGSRHDWQIFLELTSRLEALRGRPLRAALRRRLLAVLGPRRLLDVALRRGPYGAGFLPLARGLSLRRLEQAPHGVDLGALAPCLPERLVPPRGTSAKRIRLVPPELAAALRQVASTLETVPQNGGWMLIGRRQVRSNNSWMHNVPRLMKGKDRCTLLMHPEDATRLGVADGQRVVVRSRVGRVEVPLEVSDEMSPGVVSLPHGWGHNRPGTRLHTAALQPGASINDLTDDRRLDPVCGNAAFSGLPVEIEPLTQAV